MNDILAKWIY